ncbi:MAG: DUF262 domain-containing protein [Rhodospirillales bacterium]|nr:DUF262 domain-containing protein [Rhodospirillales bacterium]
MGFNPEPEYLVVPKDIHIKDFHEYADGYITRPPYQRKNVWNLQKKQDLMDSLFRRYYVPKLVIREVRLDQNTTINEIIDGQQRITTVQDFFKGEFKLPQSLQDIHPAIAGKRYKELSSDIRQFIDKEIVFSADIIKNINDPRNVNHQEIATDIFWRLQQGETLNFMEVAHAKLSSLSRNVVVKYSDDITFDYESYRPVDSNAHKHPFFNLIDKDNKRMEHLKFLTRFLIIEQAGGYADVKDTAVTEFIENYIREDGIGNYSLENEGFVRDTLSTLNLVCDIFKDDPMADENSGIKELSTEYFIISFYLLVRHLRKFYALQEREKEAVKEFFYKFHERWKAADEADTDIMAFSTNRQQSINNLEVRDRIIRQLFFDYLSENGVEIVLKDEKRAFNEAEKISIYRNNKGLCQQCLAEGKPEQEAKVSWTEYQADHIFPHSLGGRTVMDNGQVLCTYHNQKKSNKVAVG